MTDIATSPTTEPQSKHADVPAWKELLEEVESVSETFSNAVEELAGVLDRFEWEDDAPEDVREAADDASTEVYSIAASVERKLKNLRAAVASSDKHDDSTTD
jgi:hypothetical protein